jgi:hypothetical protein
MPVRRRLAAAPVQEVNGLQCFQWSLDGTTNDLGEPHYQTREQARRAWDTKYRRLVWAVTPRFDVPSAARVYDGLTTLGLAFVRWHWNHVGPFPLRGALAALGRDRRNLAAFAQTKAARQIEDYLDVFARDLDAVEATARSLAACPADDRRHPGHLNTSRAYGAEAVQ